MNRIDRLTAILIHLQTKRIVKAEEISERFEISLRTVYRDVKALMEAGVPIGSEAGKGYFIVDGYHLPPVMFNQEEASAMLLAGKLVEKMTDQSVRKAFESALIKIKAVLNEAEKDHLENLQSVIQIYRQPVPSPQPEFPNNFLTDIQKAVVQKEVIQIEYYASSNSELTKREVEPIGLFYYSGGWHLIAWCRMRKDYRDFRADRIKTLQNTEKKFENQNLLSLQEYFQTVKKANENVEKIVVLFDKQVMNFANHQKYYFGFISETEQDGKMRVVFLDGYRQAMARWLISFGNAVTIEEPEELREIMIDLVDELAAHYQLVNS